MKLPKFNETFIPILSLLNSKGDLSRKEIKDILYETTYASLEESEREKKTKAGDPLLENRIGWGISYLKMAGLVEHPSRGICRITQKGREVSSKGVYSLQSFKSDMNTQRLVEKTSGAQELVEFVDGDVSQESASPQDLIDRGIDQIEREAKALLLDRVRTVNPYYFEQIVVQLFEKMGYGKAHVTRKSGDGGIDGVIDMDQLGLEKIYIQAKRYAENSIIREPLIRDFIGAINRSATKGIFVTTSTFDGGAVSKAKDAHQTIHLIDGPTLIDLMYKYGVGVQTRETYIIKAVDEDYFDLK